MSIITIPIYDIRMAKIVLTGKQYLLIVLLIVALAVSAFRLAKIGKRYGYNPWIIFLIAFFTTAIPVTIFFHIRHGGTRIEQLPTLSSRMKHRNRDRRQQLESEDKGES